MATREQLIEDFADHKYATGEKFARLINSMKVVQEPVTDPQASGTSHSFIDSISQSADGKITATKKSVVLNYAQIQDKPAINGVTLMGDKTPAQLGLATANQVEVVSNKVDKLPSGYYYGKFNSVEDLPEATEKGYAYVASSDPTVFYTYLVSGVGAEWVDSGNKMVNTIDITTPKTVETELSKGEKYYASANVNDRPAVVVAETGVVKALGYKVLNPAMSFAEQVERTQTVDNSNMIFEIKDSFNLEGGSVTIPVGCTLKFNGGKITNGSVLYQNTHIEGNAVMEVFISAGSTIDNDSVDISWFGATKDDDTFDNGAVINKVVSVFKTINLGQGSWYYSTPIVLQAINRFDCSGSMIWNNSTQKNVDTVTLLSSNKAVVNIRSIGNKQDWSTLLAQGFYADYGRNFSVRGFCAKNSNTNDIHIQNIVGFNEGIRVIGVGAGCCYNHFFDTQLQYVNVGVRLTQQDTNVLIDNIDSTTPALLLECSSAVALQANDVITLSDGNYLIDASQTTIKTLDNGSYTASSAENVYIGAVSEGTIEYTLNGTQKTIKNDISRVIEVAEGSNNCYISGAITLNPSGAKNKLVLRNGQKVFSRNSSGVYSLVKKSGIYITTGTASVTCYIVDSVQSIKAIYGGTRGWSNNNLFDNIRHITNSSENTNNVQRYSFLAKGSIFDNHGASTDVDGLIVDTYDTVNGVYVNNLSCEANRSKPAILLRNFQYSTFNVSRAEGVSQLYKFEGKCINVSTAIDYLGSGQLYNFDELEIGYVRSNLYNLGPLEEYNKGDLMQIRQLSESYRNGIWVDKKRRYFTRRDLFAYPQHYLDGYCDYMILGSDDAVPTFNSLASYQVIGFKFRVTSDVYNALYLNGWSNRFRPFVVYDTVVENGVEISASSASIELKAPSFSEPLSVAKNVFYPQNDLNAWAFHIPNYVRGFYVFISAFSPSDSTSRESFKKLTISGSGISYTPRGWRERGSTENRPTIAYTNQLYWDGTVHAQLVYNGKTWEPLEKSGAARPTFLTADNAGFPYFDTTLKKPIFWSGMAWVDANGILLSEIQVSDKSVLLAAAANSSNTVEVYTSDTPTIAVKNPDNTDASSWLSASLNGTTLTITATTANATNPRGGKVILTNTTDEVVLNVVQNCV